MKKEIILLLMIIFFSACFMTKHNSTMDKVRIGDILIYGYRHDGFHYLKVFDKERSFDIFYPVGEENFRFAGGPGPIYQLKMHKDNSKTDFYMITDIKNDTVCFFDYCYSKAGFLTQIGERDKNVINTIDSFCKEKYPFYSIDIAKFKTWYSKKE